MSKGARKQKRKQTQKIRLPQIYEVFTVSPRWRHKMQFSLKAFAAVFSKYYLNSTWARINKITTTKRKPGKRQKISSSFLYRWEENSVNIVASLSFVLFCIADNNCVILLGIRWQHIYLSNISWVAIKCWYYIIWLETSFREDYVTDRVANPMKKTAYIFLSSILFKEYNSNDNVVNYILCMFFFNNTKKSNNDVYSVQQRWLKQRNV